MPDTYTQLIIHLVFSVRFRRQMITETLRVPMEKYMTGIIQKRGHKLLAIYCMPDHVHVLIGLNPNQSISDLVKELKVNSTNWVNGNNFYPWKSRFGWQNGYGAFSYGKSQLHRVVRYIENQPEHHRRKKIRKRIPRIPPKNTVSTTTSNTSLIRTRIRLMKRNSMPASPTFE